MKTSESLDKLAEALAAAQGEFEAVTMTGKNPHFKSKYATLGDIKKATKEALSKHGLAVVQSPSAKDGRAVLISRLIHKSGQWIEDELSLKPDRGDTPQAIGSAITYARRYAKSSLLDVEGQEDDDGEAAEGRGKEDKGENNKKPFQPLLPPPQKTPQEIEHEALVKKYGIEDMEKFGVFNSKDPTEFEKLCKKLTDEKIPSDKHFEIAAKYHGQLKTMKNLESLMKLYEI